MYEVQWRTDPRPPPQRGVVLAVGVLLVASIALVVPAIRASGVAPDIAEPAPSAPPLASPASPPVFKTSGYGAITFGQSYRDFRRAVCADLCLVGRELTETARDYVQHCELVVWAGVEPDIRATTWVWLQSDQVVAIGVFDSWGAVPVLTWPGIALGEPFGPDSPFVAGWVWDRTAPVPVARTVSDERVTTLADTDSDGQLDYATVATRAGEACEIPADPLGAQAWAGSATTIADATVLGLTLGMPAEQAMAAPQWRWDGLTIGGCRRLVSQNSHATAFVRDQVIGLSADAIAGGVALGQPVDLAERFLHDIRTDGPDIATFGPDDRLTIRGRDDSGLPVTLSARSFPRLVARLDQPVYVTGTAQVSALVLGEDCRDA